MEGSTVRRRATEATADGVDVDDDDDDDQFLEISKLGSSKWMPPISPHWPSPKSVNKNKSAQFQSVPPSAATSPVINSRAVSPTETPRADGNNKQSKKGKRSSMTVSPSTTSAVTPSASLKKKKARKSDVSEHSHTSPVPGIMKSDKKRKRASTGGDGQNSAVKKAHK